MLCVSQATERGTDITDNLNMSSTPTLQDRERLRERPDSWPVMYQSWDKLVFINWPIEIDALRPLVPEPLEIDTFEGTAWLTVTPLNIYNARPIFVPPLPFVSQLYELNVRTYVHLDGVPGVWFFSLDANSVLAVTAARTLFYLPYFNAEIDLKSEGRSVAFDSRRDKGDAVFSASWAISDELPPAEPGSLDYFLVERYCLYSTDGENLYRCRIHHRPWPLQTAADFELGPSTVVQADGLPQPSGEPLLFCGGPVDVEVWPLEKVASVGT